MNRAMRASRCGRFRLFVGAITLVWGTAHAEPRAERHSPDSFRSVGSLETGTGTKRWVVEQLTTDRELDASSISVEVKEGIVELKGTVPVGPWRERAARIAGLVKGVRGVVNRIRVEPVRRSDDAIAQEVRRALQSTAALSSMPIQAQAQAGVVELTGVITSWEEQQLAERVARSVPGVRFCQNQLTTRRTVRRTAANLAGDVRSRLHWDPRLQKANIQVSVQGTRVELRGTVSSATRRRRAVRAAWVKDVSAVEAAELVVSPGQAPGDHFRDTWPADAEVLATIAALSPYWPWVPFSALSMSALGGVVTLRGNVASFAEKRAAEEMVRSAVGVVELRSELRGPWWRAPAPPPPQPPPPTRKRLPRAR